MAINCQFGDANGHGAPNGAQSASSQAWLGPHANNALAGPGIDRAPLPAPSVKSDRNEKSKVEPENRRGQNIQAAVSNIRRREWWVDIGGT